MCHGEDSHETRSHDRYGGRRQPIQHSILKVFYHVIGARKSGYRPSLNLSIRMSHKKYAKQLTPYSVESHFDETNGDSRRDAQP